MEALPPFLVILFLPPQLLRLCLHPSDAMTLLLHYWLASSGDPSFLRTFLFAGYLFSRHLTLITNLAKRLVLFLSFSKDNGLWRSSTNVKRHPICLNILESDGMVESQSLSEFV